MNPFWTTDLLKKLITVFTHVFCLHGDYLVTIYLSDITHQVCKHSQFEVTFQSEVNMEDLAKVEDLDKANDTQDADCGRMFSCCWVRYF